ncbi:MAG TPA: hypothetical protein DCX06_13090 [Opitutae bacterium]|nr:hypothetical protein [Opitutae bacterium]
MSSFELKNLWVSDPWADLLKNAGLLEIESLGDRKFDWFEEPNRRRGGWSGVSRLSLNPDASEAEQQIVFLKIQQNHYYVSWRNLFLKKLSYKREFYAIRELSPITESLPKVVLFTEWKQNGEDYCLIITEALDGWQSLEDFLLEEPGHMEIQKVLIQIANSIRTINQARWAHFGLFQKHILIRPKEVNSYEIKLIDFEKARKTLTRNQSIIEDVSRFLRHSKNLSEEFKIYFLKQYFQTEQFTSAQKQLIRKMRGVPKI